MVQNMELQELLQLRREHGALFSSRYQLSTAFNSISDEMDSTT